MPKAAAAKQPAAKLPVPAVKVTVAAPPPVVSGAAARPVVQVPDTAVILKKLTHRLRKMGDKRPTKLASLWLSLKSFLGGDATEESVEVALARPIEEVVVKVTRRSALRIRGSMPGQRLLLPRFESGVQQVLQAAMVRAMTLLLPGFGGPRRLPAARGRAVALRVEPPGYRRLAP